LTPSFIDRLEAKKREYLEDNRAKLELVCQNLEQKEIVISQAIENLLYITFDKEQGLLADQVNLSSALMNDSTSSLEEGT
jgi:hypothetical protein